MTLKEIAEQANVSISTVSRVINQKKPGAASAEVSERIWEIVRKSGYIPNRTAQNLKMGVTNEAQHIEPKNHCHYLRKNRLLVHGFFLFTHSKGHGAGIV